MPASQVYISIYETRSAVYNLVRALPQLICVLVCRSRFGTQDNSYLSFRLGRRLGRNRNFGSSSNIRNCEVSRACPWVRRFLLCQIYLLSEQVGGSSAVFLCMRASEPRIMPYPTGDGRRAPAILPWAHGPVSWGLPCNHENADHVPARHDFRFIATQWLQQIIIWDTPVIYTLTTRCWLLATTSW